MSSFCVITVVIPAHMNLVTRFLKVMQHLVVPISIVRSLHCPVISRRMTHDLEDILPDSQAGFRPARGTRDNVCILKWTIKMVLREAREAVITFIDYSAAFDTESHLFLDEALRSAGISIKIRRMIQCIYRVAKGCVRISKADGTFEYFNIFDISRGVLQGDIFSPVAFIVGLWRIFKLYDRPNAGITLGCRNYAGIRTIHSTCV